MRIFGPNDFEKALADARPKIGNYGWIYAILRWRVQKTGWMPRRIFNVLKRFLKDDKPYYIGTTQDGIRFLGDWRDEYSVHSTLHPDTDSKLIAFLKKEIAGRPGAFLDVGTNMGTVASAMALALPGEEVVAFEPMEPIALRAAATFALNGVKNARLVVAALSNEDGEITFYHPEGHSQWASTTPTDMGGVFTWIESKVPCRTMDWVMEEMGVKRVALVKVDVEGHERETLQGAQKLLARDAPKVIFEYNFDIAPKKGLSPTDVTDVLDSASTYRYRVLAEDGSVSDFPPAMAETGHVDIICEPAPA